jgi:hypothetical protein
MSDTRRPNIYSLKGNYMLEHRPEMDEPFMVCDLDQLFGETASSFDCVTEHEAVELMDRLEARR